MACRDGEAGRATQYRRETVGPWDLRPCVDAKLIGDIARETIGLFGAERCLFGSNFPIEKLWSGYGELIAAYRLALADMPADMQERYSQGPQSASTGFSRDLA